MKPLRDGTYLAIILLVFLGTNLFVINLDRDVWFDEACSMEMVSKPYSYFIWEPKDVHPPGYYIALKAWQSVVGIDTFDARFFSLIFGLLGIVFLYFLLKNFYDAKVAQLTILIMPFLTSYLQYFTEIRMYSMFFFFSVSSFYFLVKFFDTKKPKFLWLYVLFVIPFPYIHWYMIYPFMMQVLYVLMYHRQKVWLIEYLTASAVYILAWIPALIYFFRQFVRIESMWLQAASFRSYFSAINYFFFHTNTNLMGNVENIIGYGVVLFTAIMIFLYVMKVEKKNEKKHTLYFMLYALLPITIGLGVQLFFNVYHHRYFLFMGWAYIVLIMKALTFKEKGFFYKLYSRFFIAFLVMAIVIQLGTYYSTVPYELRTMNEYIRDNGYCNSDWVLLHESPFSSVPTQYYMRLYGCNNTNYLYSLLTECQLHSTCGDVIEHSTILSKKANVPRFNVLYFQSMFNMTYNLEAENLLTLEGINLIAGYRPRVNHNQLGIVVNVVNATR